MLMTQHFDYRLSANMGDKLKGHQHRWLCPGNMTFLEVASMVVTWWIVTFLPSANILTTQNSNLHDISCKNAVTSQSSWPFSFKSRQVGCYWSQTLAHGQVDRVLESSSEGLGFASKCWSCVEVLGKLCIPHCLGSLTRDGYLVHRFKVGSIVAGCIGAHLARGKVWSEDGDGFLDY